MVSYNDAMLKRDLQQLTQVVCTTSCPISYRDALRRLPIVHRQLQEKVDARFPPPAYLSGDRLPEAPFVHMFTYLSSKERLSTRCVSKTWHTRLTCRLIQTILGKGGFQPSVFVKAQNKQTTFPVQCILGYKSLLCLTDGKEEVKAFRWVGHSLTVYDQDQGLRWQPHSVDAVVFSRLIKHAFTGRVVVHGSFGATWTSMGCVKVAPLTDFDMDRVEGWYVDLADISVLNRNVAINETSVYVVWSTGESWAMYNSFWLGKFTHGGVQRWKVLLQTCASRTVHHLAATKDDRCVVVGEHSEIQLFDSLGHRTILDRLAPLHIARAVCILDHCVYTIDADPNPRLGAVVRVTHLDGTRLGRISWQSLSPAKEVWLSVYATQQAVLVGTNKGLLVSRNEFS
jgi:hypothetical protein